MSSQSAERALDDLREKVLPIRNDLFLTHPISEEEQAETAARLYPNYKRQQEAASSGRKIVPRMEDLQDTIPLTTNRHLAATRLTAKYIALYLVADTYRQAVDANRRKQVPEFCFYVDIGWGQFQIATNINIANRTGNPLQKAQEFEQRIEEGQRRSPLPPDIDTELVKAVSGLQIAISYGQSLFLLDEDPTGQKLIDHYVGRMQDRQTAQSELHMHPAQGLKYISLGGEMFRKNYDRLYPTALSLRPRPELRFS